VRRERWVADSRATQLGLGKRGWRKKRHSPLSLCILILRRVDNTFLKCGTKGLGIWCCMNEGGWLRREGRAEAYQVAERWLRREGRAEAYQVAERWLRREGRAEAYQATERWLRREGRAEACPSISTGAGLPRGGTVGAAVLAGGVAGVFLEDLSEVALIAEAAVQTDLDEALLGAGEELAGFLHAHLG